MLETLEDLLPHLDGVTTAKELGRRIIDLGVPVKLKFKLACAARDTLGVDWTDKSVRDKLNPGRHTGDRAEKQRAAVRTYRATEEGRDKANAATRAASRALRATPEGREKANAAARATHRATRATEEGREKHRASSLANKNAYHQPGGRYETDPLYRLKCTLRKGVARISKATSTTKNGSMLELPDGNKVAWRELLGCSLHEANAIIESRFLPGMTWKNQGTVWHLDHHFPIKAYQDTPTLEVLELVNHIDNLWPLWGPENLEKGDKYCPQELAAALAQRAAA